MTQWGRNSSVVGETLLILKHLFRLLARYKFKSVFSVVYNVLMIFFDERELIIILVLTVALGWL